MSRPSPTLRHSRQRRYQCSRTGPCPRRWVQMLWSVLESASSCLRTPRGWSDYMRSCWNMMADDISLRDVMLRASLIMIVVLVTTKALGYLFHFWFVRNFPQEVYGSFIYLWTAGLFLCGFLLPNIAASISRYVAYYRGRGDSKGVDSTIRTGLIINMAWMSGVIVLIALAYSYGFMPKIHDPRSFLFVVAVLVLTSVTNLLSGVLNGYRKPEVASAFNLLLNVLRFIALVAAVFLASSLLGVMAFVILAFLLYALFLASHIMAKYGLGSSYDRGLSWTLLSFGLFTIFYETGNNLLQWADIFLLNLFIGPAVVAVYNISWLASTTSLIFFISAVQIFRPIVTEFFGSGRKDMIGYVTSYLFESFFLLFMPVFLSVVLFARELLVFFFNPDYASGVVPLQILSIGAFFTGLGLLYVELINAEGKPAVNARNIGVSAVLNVMLNLFLIPSYGMVGAAFATLSSSSLLFLLSYRHVSQVVRLSYSKARIVKLVASSFIAVVIVSSVKAAIDHSILSLIVSVPSLFLLYLLLLIGSRSLRSEDTGLADAFMEKIMLPDSIRSSVSSFLERGVQSTSSP
ncbi:MAG: oligosaccharide flippase family protein [Candidatus Altiarchaeales archaeon]|nr:oligosaccharide flippase family protein [Candidatus Altiarchaeales archaeon]MBD3415630.1 oligosaccharide flippase family protein [Candidatus Altiarchaeales archaeon]